MDMPTYCGYRTSEGPTVIATRPGTQTPLPHLVRFSPDGFEWGNGGSGPKDLARSIVGHYLGVDEPPERLAAAVWHNITAQLPNEAWAISATELNETLRNTDPGPWTVPLGRTVSTAAVGTELCAHDAGIAFVELCLIRHKHGDWGDLDDHETEVNKDAVASGARVLSVYPIPDYLITHSSPSGQQLYVITDATDDNRHRLATTVCYPHES